MNSLPDTHTTFAGYFIVAFVDLLGTDAKNAEIKTQPEFPTALLEEEVNKVKAFHRDFRQFFANSKRAEEKLEAQRPQSLKTAFEGLQGNAIISNGFSDSLIFYASLNTARTCKVPLVSCYELLTALASAQLCSLARGCPFRGGVEIGRAAQFGDNQILGPVLSDAVKLESQAQFPRILIGKEFIRYLELNMQLTSETPENHAQKEFARLCVSQICTSDESAERSSHDKSDGAKNEIWSLDIKSDHFAELVGPSHQGLLKKAISFAELEMERFGGHDEKLACRYNHLLNYLTSER